MNSSYVQCLCHLNFCASLCRSGFSIFANYKHARMYIKKVKLSDCFGSRQLQERSQAMFNVRALLASVPPWLPPPLHPLPILLPPSGDKSHLNWPSCHHDGATGGRRRKLGMRHRYTYCSAPKCKKAKITSRIKGFSEIKNRTTLLNQIRSN